MRLPMAFGMGRGVEQAGVGVGGGEESERVRESVGEREGSTAARPSLPTPHTCAHSSKIPPEVVSTFSALIMTIVIKASARRMVWKTRDSRKNLVVDQALMRVESRWNLAEAKTDSQK